MINLHRILGALRTLKHPLMAAALMGIGLLVVGCGQKGPLFIATDVPAHAKPSKPTEGAGLKAPPSE